MSARVIVVDDDREALVALEACLSEAGHDVAAFDNSIRAYDVLTGPEQVQLLVTRVAFQPGRPHGIALVNAARLRRPTLKAIFLARSEIARHVQGEGEIFILPADPRQIVQAVNEMLGLSSRAEVSALAIGNRLPPHAADHNSAVGPSPS